MIGSKIEIRDPLYGFIRLQRGEQAILDTAAFQRLRFIHQLGLSYLIYPGATHRRFEHSLGVMELSTRIFDIITDRSNAINEASHAVIPEDPARFLYWKRVLRVAALCHDLGHLPFSHAAEDLLPEGWKHELITRKVIFSDKLQEVWNSMEPPLRPEHIALLAVGEISVDDQVSAWQGILREIIQGDVFGADRMDYLLRDSLHSGVAYGRFDYDRLVQTLRILPSPPIPESSVREPTIGIEEGGVHAAEGLLLARYFMFKQVYLHRTRRIYDLHLADFVKEWRRDADGYFATNVDEHLALTDNELLQAILAAAREKKGCLSVLARRITERSKRFVLMYEPAVDELRQNADAARAIAAAAASEFGGDAVRLDTYTKEDEPFDFPVQEREGDVVSYTGKSQVLGQVPPLSVNYVFVDANYRDAARKWLQQNRECVIKSGAEQETSSGRSEDAI
ncbi:MAG: HD domain-containing protein [Actinomycetia bacterium]|nr:HD domain-containing protein [Actinomycetes bacterium]